MMVIDMGPSGVIRVMWLGPPGWDSCPREERKRRPSSVPTLGGPSEEAAVSSPGRASPPGLAQRAPGSRACGLRAAGEGASVAGALAPSVVRCSGSTPHPHADLGTPSAAQTPELRVGGDCQTWGTPGPAWSRGIRNAGLDLKLTCKRLTAGDGTGEGPRSADLPNPDSAERTPGGQGSSVTVTTGAVDPHRGRGSRDSSSQGKLSPPQTGRTSPV